MQTLDILNLGREWTYISEEQYPNDKGIVDLNIVYRDIIAQINQDVNEDLFADYFYSDSVLGQSEYTLPAVDNINKKNGLGNILNVYVNYTKPVNGIGTVSTTSGSNTITGVGTEFDNSLVGSNIIVSGISYRVTRVVSPTVLNIAGIDTELPTSTLSGLSYQTHSQDYKKVIPQRASNLAYGVEWYQTGQSKTEPFYIKYDKSIFVYPMPDESIPLGVKIHGTYDVFDLTVAGNETPIIDDNWHYVLAIGLKRYIYQRRGMLNESTSALQEYQMEYKKMINTISDTELSPLQREVLTLNELQ